MNRLARKYGTQRRRKSPTSLASAIRKLRQKLFQWIAATTGSWIPSPLWTLSHVRTKRLSAEGSECAGERELRAGHAGRVAGVNRVGERGDKLLQCRRIKARDETHHVGVARGP